jgi:hypothetical protein
MRRMLLLGVLVLAASCRKEEAPMVARDAEPTRGSDAWKIRNARSAAPSDIAMAATVLDWPASDTAQPRQLASGTNGWSCYPDDLRTPSTDPVCLDDVMGQWFASYTKHQPPHITAMGVVYALQGGDYASATDPFKMEPDSGQSWHQHGPFVVIAMPNPARSFAGLATAPNGGQPWVMYAGTPYAHLMVPVAR